DSAAAGRSAIFLPLDQNAARPQRHRNIVNVLTPYHSKQRARPQPKKISAFHFATGDMICCAAGSSETAWRVLLTEIPQGPAFGTPSELHTQYILERDETSIGCTFQSFDNREPITFTYEKSPKNAAR